MEIRHEMQDKTMVIYLEGSLDYPSAQQLDEYLADKYKNVWSMVFDMEKLDYTSSAGIRLLLKNELLMRKRGGLKLIHVNHVVQNVLSISGFDKILVIE